MTMDDFINKRKKQLDDLLNNNKPFKLAVLSTSAEQSQRIFIHGEATDGSVHQYDTRHPLYVNPEKSPRKSSNKAQGIQGLVPTKGKHGDHIFKNGKVHKTTFLNNYKEFQNRIGRPIDRVHYFHTGEFQSDYSSIKIAGSAPHNPEKISQHEYHITLKREGSSQKLSGLENKYGEISKLNAKEHGVFTTVLNKEMQAHFQ